jgi:hypothetical protein
MTHGLRSAARFTISRRISLFTLAVKRSSCVSPGVMGRSFSVCGPCRFGHPVPIYARTYACMGERGFHARCLFGRIFGLGAIILDQVD